jgi:hypothetical protein
MKIRMTGTRGLNGVGPGQILEVSEACGRALLDLHKDDKVRSMEEYTGEEIGKPIIAPKNEINGLGGPILGMSAPTPVKRGPGRPKSGA